MVFSFTIPLISLILVISIIHSGNSCACKPVSHDDHFCLSNFVIIAQMTKNASSQCSQDNQWFMCLERYFEIEIMEAFKLPVGVEFNTSRIYTPGDTVMCGIFLECTRTYILTGHIDDKKMIVTECDWIRQLRDGNTMDEFYVAKLQTGGYAANCPGGRESLQNLFPRFKSRTL